MRSLRLSERCYVFACTIPTTHLYSHRFKYMIANKVDVTWFNCNYDRLLLMFGQRSSVTENRFTEEKSSHFTNALIPMTFCFRLYLSFWNVNGKSNHEWWTRCRDEVRNIANWNNNKIATKQQQNIKNTYLGYFCRLLSRRYEFLWRPHHSLVDVSRCVGPKIRSRLQLKGVKNKIRV